MLGSGRRLEILRVVQDWEVSMASSTSATWRERTWEGVRFVSLCKLRDKTHYGGRRRGVVIQRLVSLTHD